MSQDTDCLEVNARIRIPMREFNFKFARSSGPGGQNVNKVSSKAQLFWDIHQSPSLPADVRQRFIATFANKLNASGEVMVVSDAYRDQGRNVADCLEKLSVMLESVTKPPKVRKKTKPTRSSRERRHESKRALSSKKEGRKRVDY